MKNQTPRKMLSVFTPLIIAGLLLIVSIVFLLNRSNPLPTEDGAYEKVSSADTQGHTAADSQDFASPGRADNDVSETDEPPIYISSSFATRGSLILHALYMNLGALDRALPISLLETRKAASEMITGNGDLKADERKTLTAGFYHEPISDELFLRIQGLSYPAEEAITVADDKPVISRDELRYLHVFHYGFDGKVNVGEMIVNESIADDLLAIFHELYRAEYPIERMVLVDNYDADDERSMADNNSSAFNYRVIAGTTRLSNHSYGLAVDINPLQNPYVTFDKDGNPHVAPGNGEAYADRTSFFEHKIDHEDLCYTLFAAHGFDWGGDWTHSKDYQHFEKTP